MPDNDTRLRITGTYGNEHNEPVDGSALRLQRVQVKRAICELLRPQTVETARIEGAIV